MVAGCLSMAAVLFGVTTTPAMAQSCSLSTVKGTYGVLGSGTALGIGPVTAVGVATLDGAGSVTYIATENYDGEIIPGTLTGTYTLSSNCTGTVTVPGFADYAAVVVSRGQEIDLIGTSNPGTDIVQTAVAKRIGIPPTPGCSLSTVKGNYGILSSGTSAGDPITAVDLLTLDGAGNLTYTSTENVAGYVISGTFSGTYTLTSNCTGTVTIPEVPSGTLTLDAVVVDGGQELYIMGATTSVPPAIIQTAVAKRIN
jgi:hypothetical protein